MSKRSHPGTAAAAAAAAVPTRATHVTAADSHAAAASSSSATGPSAKRIKFDDLVSSGFGAEAYGGKAGRGSAPTKSSVGGLALGQVEPERKSADDDGDGDGPSSAPLSAEEEMEAILRLVDSAPEVPEVDAAAARAILSKFGKAATKNLEMRAKFAAQPERFMESELALDESIHALQGLSSAAAHYPLLLEPVAGGDSAMDTLCSLIIHHENIDVSIDCIALLNELVDAETIGQEGDDIAPFVEFITGGTAAAASSGSAAAAASSSSAAAAAASSSAGGGGPSLFLSTLVSALQRFPSEHAKEQSDAVTNLLSVLENLTDLEPQRVSTALVQHTQLLEWIMKRLRDETFNQNKLYASEILSIVLTNAGVAGQDQMGARVLDGLGIKALIRYIAKYRKEDPSNSEETEYLENLFDALCVCLHSHADNQRKFADHDGLQLMLTMIKRQTYAKSAAFKAIDYAVQNCPASCSHLIDLGGLKIVFGTLMFNPQSKKDRADATATELHLLQIITQLFLHCADVRYLRVLRKFQEQEMLKTERIVELLVKYQTRVDEAEAKHAAAHGSGSKDEHESLVAYMRQSEHGLTHVELCTIVLAFLATAGDKPLRERVEQLLNQQDIPLSALQRTLRQYVDMMGESSSEAIGHTKKVLQALATMLDE